MTKLMSAAEIRALTVRVQKSRDLRGVEVALVQTDARTAKAREALRLALACRESAWQRPTYAVSSRVAERRRMGLPVTPSKRRAYATDVQREQLDEIVALKVSVRIAWKKRQIEAVSRDLLPAYERCGYRRSTSTWAGGDHHVEVVVGVPLAVGWSDKTWSENRKWTGTTSTHCLTVRRDYGSRVPEAWRVVGGLLTLDLEAEVEPGIRPATWVEQGRGVSLNTVHGYLVETAARGLVHAETMAGARKARTVTARPRLDLGEMDPTDLLQRARLTGNERVTMDLAHDNGRGVCFAGMRDWLTKRGVDWTARESLTAREIADMAIASKDRVEEVYRVLLIVARVHRQSARDMTQLAA